MSMRDSERSTLVGGHVPPRVKSLLTEEAKKKGVSVSRLINEAVVNELRKRGYQV